MGVVYHKRVFKTAKLIEDSKYKIPLIELSFPFNKDLIQFTKSLKNWSYKPAQNKWFCEYSKESIDKLIANGFILDKNLKENKPNLSKELNLIGFNLQLMSFQKEGVNFIDHRKGRALISDEMGLGKTIQAIAWLYKNQNIQPVLIICPSSLKYNWKNEIERCFNYSKVQIIQGTNPYELYGKILIINYDLLQYWVDFLKNIALQAVIIDEAHYIKESSSIRSKAVKFLVNENPNPIPNVLCLTGTPIENRPIEFYNIWKLIDPKNCPPYQTFGYRYCGGKDMNFKGATNKQELYNILSNAFMIRRLKKDVLPELPEKTRSIIPIEIDNWKDYEKCEQDFIEYLRNFKGNQAALRASNSFTFAKITMLKQIAAKGKLNGCIEWVSDYLQNENKLVVFATHLFVIDELVKAFPNNSVKLTGDVPSQKRKDLQIRFQEDPNINLFIGMLDLEGKPAGVGLTLTAAKATATIGFQWSPKVHDQAEDRIHRITQKFPVNNYYLVAMNTIEEKILGVLDRKTKTIDPILDGSDPHPDTLLGELLKFYK